MIPNKRNGEPVVTLSSTGIVDNESTAERFIDHSIMEGGQPSLWDLVGLNISVTIYLIISISIMVSLGVILLISSILLRQVFKVKLLSRSQMIDTEAVEMAIVDSQRER